MKRNHFLPLLGLFLAATSAGCSSSANVSLPAWQKSVETYVSKQGGDPNALRNMTWKDTRHGFSIIANDDPGSSTDANGVLLAHRVIADRPWFVFIVGLVKKQKVSDIGAAALSMEGGKYNWRMGNKDEAALKAYRNYNDGLWRGRFQGRKTAPPDYLGFPREEDVFEWNAEGEQVRINHPASGAQWEVNLSPAKKK